MEVNIYYLRRTFLVGCFALVQSLTFASVTQIPGGQVDTVRDRLTTTHKLKVNDKRGVFDIRIHFNQKHHDFVARVSEIIKSDTPALIQYFDYVPDIPLHIFINGAVNQSNGSATSFPKLLMNLYDYPPAGWEHLNISGDWLRNLVVHEMVHILHHAQINGFNKVINTIFGAGRLIPMLVPRWFSEGIATWAETNFTEAGRLRNPLFKWEMDRTFLQKDFCYGAGCVDNPGRYPFGQFPYWAGSFFMRHLEKEKPGTIKCLVRANSSKVPFFLNTSFEECLRKDAVVNYRMFHIEYESEVKEQIKKLKKSKKTINYNYIDVEKVDLSFQSGFHLADNKLGLVTIKNRDASLMLVNLDDKSIEIKQPEDALDGIDLIDNKFYAYTQSFRGDAPRRFTSYNLEKNQFEKIKTKKKYIYLTPIENGNYLGWGYRHSRWRLYLIDSAIKDAEKREKQIYIFPKNWQIYRPQKINGKISFLYFNNKNQMYSLAELEKGYKKILLTSEPLTKKIIHDQFTCGDDLYLKTDNELFRRKGSRIQVAPASSDIIFSRVSEQYELHLYKNDPRRLYFRASNCQKFAKKYNFKNSQRMVAYKGKDETSKKLNKSLDVVNLSDIENYYSAANLGFNYWLLSLNFDRNLFNTSFETSISDPRDILNFDLKAIQYFEISETGYDASVNYNFYGNWSFVLGGNKIYTNTGYQGLNTASYNEVTFSGLGYLKQFNRWQWVPLGIYSNSEENDFISNRTSQSYGVSNYFTLLPKKFNAFVPRLEFWMNHYYQETEGRQNFVGEKYFLDFSFKYHPRLMQHFFTTYSKLHKTDFGSGVLYGGRFNEIEVLGIATNDLFGNEILTTRTQFDFSLDKFYQKDSIFPWYNRELHLIAGGEWFKSDFGFIADKLFARHDWYSVHAGLRLQSTIAYFIPIDIDFLYTSTVDPLDERTNQWVTTIKASWWP